MIKIFKLFVSDHPNNTNYNTKVMTGTCGAYIKVIFFSGLLHTLRLFWKTATYKQKLLVYLDSENCILFYINVAVDLFKQPGKF